MSPLQIITHNIPNFVRKPLEGLISEECYQTLVYDVNFDSPYCLRYSISKLLGFGIVLGGSIVKVPQIIKIVRSKSARGLSLSSYWLDTASLGITVAYNLRNQFPWSTYGENVFLLIQNVIITFLIMALSTSPSTRLPYLATFTLIFLLSTYLLSSPTFTPLPTLQLLAASCIPLSLSSKLPQILTNFRSNSTGQLSAFLVFNSLVGCAARVFTTATETGDKVLWWGFVLATLLNGVLAVQMGLYWNNKGEGGSSASASVKGKEKERLTSGTRLEKVNVEKGATSPQIGGQRPTSPPGSAKRYVRKLE